MNCLVCFCLLFVYFSNLVLSYLMLQVRWFRLCTRRVISVIPDLWRPSMESHFGQKRSSFSRTVENFLGRSRFFSDGRVLSRTVEIFLGRSSIFSDGREFSRTVENFLGRSRFFSDGRYFSGTVEIFLGRSRFFSDGRDFSRTVENFLGRSRIFSDGRYFKFFSVGRDFPSNSPAFPSV